MICPPRRFFFSVAATEVALPVLLAGIAVVSLEFRVTAGFEGISGDSADFVDCIGTLLAVAAGAVLLLSAAVALPLRHAAIIFRPAGSAMIGWTIWKRTLSVINLI